ncbi:aldehyde dehydrogenase family protein [uncultured Paludibaculum sp.]|uniref:aldehyde dehydrogenase family protein n=1 Tax=uncultured Paludibaculum sp. TaxID=1765020 RepID=UPI002AAB85EA|nr:aldehyde dehydrogenase family protein [uncultured Paludibaculum sp.]
MLHDTDLVSVQEVREKVEKAYTAWQTYKNFTQEQIDAVVEAVAAKGRAHARRLAEFAVRETGMGNVEDKYAKNMLCSDTLIRAIRSMKTVGVLREIPEQQITEVGVPQGVIAAICPTTNPTSTVFFKTIIALKAGNAIVLSPHPRAKECTCAAAALLAEAAEEAGAPAGIVQCASNSTLEGTQALMKHPKTGVILATGGSGMVRAAYSSGKPAFGVGPGNVPVLIDTSANLAQAVARVVSGKSFDFGTVCSSEQTVVAEGVLRERMLAEFRARKAYILNPQERAAVERTLFSSGTTVRADCVGKSPQTIAQLAGISVPADATILVAEIDGVGREHPLSAEKLSPVLALLFVDSFEAGLDACEAILKFGGLGHTCVIHAGDEAKVRRFGLRMPAFRVLVNTAAPQGSVGITTNVQPSMTLGCGAIAGNITSDNVGPQHLINIKRIAWAVRDADPAPVQPAALNIDKAALVAAVERYLAQRGVNVSGATLSAAVAAAIPAHAPAAAPIPRPPVHGSVASAAERFLAANKPEAAPVSAAPSCGCSIKPADPGTAAAPVPATIPAPKIEIVSFVCEADVREAIAKKKKIFIGPKTIVTPSAKDLAGPDEILVRAER